MNCDVQLCMDIVKLFTMDDRYFWKSKVPRGTSAALMRSTHNWERVLLGGSTGSGGTSRGTSGSGGTIRGTSWKWRVSDDCYLHLHQHVALCWYPLCFNNTFCLKFQLTQYFENALVKKQLQWKVNCLRFLKKWAQLKISTRHTFMIIWMREKDDLTFRWLSWSILKACIMVTIVR